MKTLHEIYISIRIYICRHNHNHISVVHSLHWSDKIPLFMISIVEDLWAFSLVLWCWIGSCKVISFSFAWNNKQWQHQPHIYIHTKHQHFTILPILEVLTIFDFHSHKSDTLLIRLYDVIVWVVFLFSSFFCCCLFQIVFHLLPIAHKHEAR